MGERASGTRTLASAKTLWQENARSKKPRGGEVSVDGVSERRKKGFRETLGHRNGIDSGPYRPLREGALSGDRAADMI